MAGADGVAADGLELEQAALPDAQRHGGADPAAVLVEADPAQFDVVAVDPETGRGLETKLADSEAQHLAILQAGGGRHLGDQRVKRRCFRRPAAGAGERREGDDRQAVFTGGEGGRGGGAAELAAVGGAHDHGEGGRLGGEAVVDHPGLHSDLGALGGGHRGEYLQTVEGEVHGIKHHQAHLAVDARTGIPAVGRLDRVVNFHSDEVVAVHQRRGQVVAEGAVAAGAETEGAAIAKHLALEHDTVELDPHRLAAQFGGEAQGGAVPAEAVGEKSAGAAAGVFLGHRAGDRPIVGDADRLPGAVGHSFVLGPGRVAEVEAPALGQGEFLEVAVEPGFRSGGGGGSGVSCQEIAPQNQGQDQGAEGGK